MTQGTARHFMPVPPHVARTTRQASNPHKSHGSICCRCRRAPSPNRATWPPSSSGPDTRTRHSRPRSAPRAEAADKVGSRARYRRRQALYRPGHKYLWTCWTRPAPTKETNKPTRPPPTHTPSEQNGKRKKSERLSYPVLRSRKTGTGGSVVHLF